MLVNLPAWSPDPQILTTDQSWVVVSSPEQMQGRTVFKGSEVFGLRSLGEAAGRNEENTKKWGWRVRRG